MTMLKSEFLHIAKERGFFHQCTDLAGLDKVLHEQKGVTAYIGFDCTGPSLHVGSLMQIMILRLFQKCGHRPIVLMGGGTTKVGDPSGKDESRKLLDDEQIHLNMQGIKAAFEKFIDFEGGKNLIAKNNALMVNNADWLDKLNYIEFLRDYGRHFSVNKMLGMDSVKIRLERDQHLSFLEFNYMILQAYDFVELRERYGCILQIGGSDQWGNITMGVALDKHITTPELKGDIRLSKSITDDWEKQYEASKTFGFTTPLLTTSSGAKMGKTANGAVWLNADMLPVFDYWQYWRNTEDGDVGRFLRFFTELPIAEIEKLEKLQGAEINEAKKILADEATRLCHGEEAAQAAAETAHKTFVEGGAGDNLKTVFIEEAALKAGISAVDLLHLTGMKESKGEARKLIEGGGARINDEKITDPKMPVTLANLTSDGYIKLSAGKKQHLLVKIKA